MQAATDQAADLPQDTHARRAYNETSLVQLINLEDESISPGLRANASDLDTVQKELTAYLKAESTRDGAGETVTNTISTNKVRALLNEVAEQLQDPLLKARYLNPRISDKEMFEVLRYTSSEKRLDFIRQLHSLAKHEKVSEKFLERKLDNVIHYTTTQERVVLMKEWLRHADRDATMTFMLALCQASQSFEQLCSVVNQTGVKALLKTGDSDMREYVAHAVIGSKLREIVLPSIPKNVVDAGSVHNTLSAIQWTLELAEKICMEDPVLSRTTVAKEFAYSARFNLYYLKVDYMSTNSINDLKELVNTMAVKVPLEFKYGLCFKYSEGTSFKDSPSRRWTVQDLQQASEVLKELPEGKILFSPNLHEITRVIKLGPYVASLRDWDGEIQVSDKTDAGKKDPSYFFKHSLAHEIGHGVHLGHWWTDLKQYLSRGPLITGEPENDVGEFWKLSDWKVIEKRRYTLNEKKGEVTLDGENYKLSTPIVHHSENIVLTTQYGYLFSYAASAKFGERSYSHSSPFEDFAEAFTDYCLKPESLIKNAPKKFWHLEQEFRKYENNSAMMEELHRALEAEK